MTVLLSENSIVCEEDSLVLRHYYPWGSKTIRYTSIVGVQRVRLTPVRGQLRVWGSANPTLWANLDGRRPKKSVGLILDIGKKVKPYVTPDDLAHVEGIIRERAGLGPGTPAILSPFI